MANENGDLLRVTTSLNYGGLGVIQNVYTYQLTTILPVGDSDLGAQVAEVADDMYGEIVSDMSGDVTFEDVRVFNITQDREVGVFPWPTRTVGTGSGEAIAPGVSLLVKLGTGFIKELGRKFLGGYTEGSSGGGGWTSPALGRAASFLTHLIGFVSGSDITISLQAGIVNKSGVFHVFTNGSISGVAAYQRRRRQYRGI
jgi:hypothetical protein